MQSSHERSVLPMEVTEEWRMQAILEQDRHWMLFFPLELQAKQGWVLSLTCFISSCPSIDPRLDILVMIFPNDFRRELAGELVIFMC